MQIVNVSVKKKTVLKFKRKLLRLVLLDFRLSLSATVKMILGHRNKVPSCHRPVKPDKLLIFLVEF